MFYCDTSALVKLILEEPESAELRRFLGRGSTLASSELVATELARGVLRRTTGAEPRVAAVLRTLSLVTLDRELLDLAGRLKPPTLRSLDAIHLATALMLREELEAFVAYDERLLTAASDLGLPVASPGRS